MRIVGLLLTLIACTITVYAQDTYYYKQVKVEKKGSTIAQGNGGQFISFYKDICYDSNNKGISVNNGQMERTSKSGDKYTTYEGNSYWGKVTYYFSTSLDRLVVQKSDGTSYMYQRATPPAGQTTCTLIKSRSSSGGTSSGWGYTPPPTNNNGWSDSQSTTQSGGAAPSPKWDYVYREESCPECYNSGKCTICKGKGSWTNSYTGNPHPCSACNQSGRCSKCGGKGTITTKKLEKH